MVRWLVTLLLMNEVIMEWVNLKKNKPIDFNRYYLLRMLRPNSYNFSYHFGKFDGVDGSSFYTYDGEYYNWVNYVSDYIQLPKDLTIN